MLNTMVKQYLSNLCKKNYNTYLMETPLAIRKTWHIEAIKTSLWLTTQQKIDAPIDLYLPPIHESLI
ncbi:hypothetical protein U9M48_001347 [Paspalum notatum var. saurae]|uniref:Uncharacterized protein n=1 Tax=Paspalum notatum var. saurae TaxID=547442 RepID=A0AAQ3PI60_PASNO